MRLLFLAAVSLLRPPSLPIRSCYAMWGFFSLIPLSLIRSFQCFHIVAAVPGSIAPLPFRFPLLAQLPNWCLVGLGLRLLLRERVWKVRTTPIPVILKFVQPAHPYLSYLPGFLPPHQWSLGLPFLWIFHSSLSLFAPSHSLLVPPYFYPVASFDLGLVVAVRSPGFLTPSAKNINTQYLSNSHHSFASLIDDDEQANCHCVYLNNNSFLYL